MLHRHVLIVHVPVLQLSVSYDIVDSIIMIKLEVLLLMSLRLGVKFNLLEVFIGGIDHIGLLSDDSLKVRFHVFIDI